MVEIFKTDVTEPAQADQLLKRLQAHLPTARINFDLDDCDHILRIDSTATPVSVRDVIDLLTKTGHTCEVLE